MTESNETLNYITQRVRYFDGQFLQAKDFIADQNHHISRQDIANRLLRVSGICEGLEIKVETRKIAVEPGIAINDQGKFIILKERQEIDTEKDAGEIEVYIYSELQAAANTETQKDNDYETTVESEKGVTRCEERAKLKKIAVGSQEQKYVQQDKELKGYVLIGKVNLSDKQITARWYSGIYLPSSDDTTDSTTRPGVTLRVGENKETILNGALTIQEALTVKKKLTVSGMLKLQKGIEVSGFSNDENLLEAKDDLVPTQKAVKTYVDGNFASLKGGAKDVDFKTKNLTVNGSLTLGENKGQIESVSSDISNKPQQNIVPSELAVTKENYGIISSLLMLIKEVANLSNINISDKFILEKKYDVIGGKLFTKLNFINTSPVFGGWVKVLPMEVIELNPTNIVFDTSLKPEDKDIKTIELNKNYSDNRRNLTINIFYKIKILFSSTIKTEINQIKLSSSNEKQKNIDVDIKYLTVQKIDQEEITYYLDLSSYHIEDKWNPLGDGGKREKETFSLKLNEIKTITANLYVLNKQNFINTDLTHK